MSAGESGMTRGTLGALVVMLCAGVGACAAGSRQWLLAGGAADTPVATWPAGPRSTAVITPPAPSPVPPDRLPLQL